MTSRYDSRLIGLNGSKIYRELFKKRNVGFIEHYTTPEMPYPTVDDLLDLSIISRPWQLGDRFYKLADQYYKDPALWWVIAWFNRTPTESHLEIGDVVDIPLPLERVLQLLDI